MADLSRRALVIGRAALASARVARARGDSLAAHTFAREALDVFSRLGMPHEAAEARLEMARAIAAEQRELAIDEAKGARSTFRELGAARASGRHRGIPARARRRLGCRFAERPHADRSRTAGPRPPRAGDDERADREDAVHQREDRRPPREPDPREARRAQPCRGGCSGHAPRRPRIGRPNRENGRCAVELRGAVCPRGHRNVRRPNQRERNSHEHDTRLHRGQGEASSPPGRAATTPSSARPCRSSASSSPRPCDIRWDEEVLDVAAGNGNATLAAARRGGNVTSTDYVAALLDRGAERAAAEGLSRDVRSRRRRGAAVRRRRLRRRALDLRRHVRARITMRAARRAAARVPARRPDRARQLDADEPHRPDVQRPRHVRSAGRRACSRLRSGATSIHLDELFSGRARSIAVDAARVQLPLPLGGALRRRVPRRGTARCTRRSAPCQRRRQPHSSTTLIDLLERNNTADGALVIPSEYLEVVVTRA